MFKWQTIAVSCILLMMTLTAATARSGEMVQGERERDGECIQYRIMKYQVSHGGEDTETYTRIFERPCGSTCWEEVYNGPGAVYSGEYSSLMYDPGLPIVINAGGTGYVTVPSGEGGLFAPATSQTCDATFTPDASTVFVIDSAFLLDIGLQ